MDFLEDLLDFGDRKRRNRGGYSQNEDYRGHYDNDHDDDDHHHQPPNSYQQGPTAFQQGVVCPKCSVQIVQGAKFCHVCGGVIEINPNCPSCSSKLPPNALFCPQCGYKKG